jgi:hypothetical protein
MMTLLLPILHYNRKPDGRADYSSSRQTENALLSLTTVPAITDDVEAGNTNFGRWTSPSIFLGKEMSGNFYVTRVNYLDDGSGQSGTRDNRIENPVGMFFDSTSTKTPFLILYRFAPNEMPTKSGFGMLDLPNREDVSVGVYWSRQ